jgi:hypothetical protein
VGRGLGMGERRRGGALASDSGRGGGAAIERIEAIVGFKGGGGVGTSGAKAWAQGRATSDGCR